VHQLSCLLYFFGTPGQEEEVELTFHRDGRSYELGSGYGHIALAVDDLDGTLARLREQGIESERPPDQVPRAAAVCVSFRTQISTALN
jgi:catechol 2,3-dioxygenase-like lactoylglutathione lyase family enzyme